MDATNAAPHVVNDDDDECPVLVDAKVPVTILTGFLGSGKTTLLQYILTVEHKMRIAVVVNEFEFGKSIEKGLTVRSTEKADDEWVELDNGCMCCTAKDQSVLALEKLMARKGTFDLVLVETSGMADPAPVCSMFWQDEQLQGSLFLSGVLAVVDTKNIVAYLTGEGGARYREATQQLLVADRFLFNKIDLVDDAERAAAVAAVRAVNPVAEGVFASFSRIDPAALRGMLFLNTTRAAADFQHPPPVASATGGAAEAPAPHAHSHSLTSVSLEIRAEGADGSVGAGPLAAASTRAVDFLCRDLLYHEGREAFEVVRCKAALWIAQDGGAPRLFQLQSIGATFDVQPMAGASVPVGVNRFLFLGRGLDAHRLRSLVQAYFAPTAVGA